VAFLRYGPPGRQTLWVALDKEVVTIGRGKACDLVLEDPMSSRVHCEVRKLAGGGWSLADLKSKNGTFVNGAPVSIWNLSDGDLIAIGNQMVIFKLQR
jgi:pSer/pThr/pTyr-binding forkhead associated (FHA) protein